MAHGITVHDYLQPAWRGHSSECCVSEQECTPMEVWIRTEDSHVMVIDVGIVLTTATRWTSLCDEWVRVCEPNT
jgi:hypothetical protein